MIRIAREHKAIVYVFEKAKQQQRSKAPDVASCENARRKKQKESAPSGNRTRGISLATRYFTTKPTARAEKQTHTNKHILTHTIPLHTTHRKHTTHYTHATNTTYNHTDSHIHTLNTYTHKTQTIFIQTHTLYKTHYMYTKYARSATPLTNNQLQTRKIQHT